MVECRLMRHIQLHVRTMMVAVAIMAILIASGFEGLRLKRLSDRYEFIAYGYRQNLRSGLQDLARLQSMLKEAKEARVPVAAEVERLAISTDWARANIAANANLVQLYEHAASHPWEPAPRATEAHGHVEDAPVPKRVYEYRAEPKPHRPPGV